MGTALASIPQVARPNIMADPPDVERRRNASLDLQMFNTAKLAAKEAVTETLKLFGIDINDIDSVNEFRDDLRFLHVLRAQSEAKSRETRKAFITTLFSVIGGCIVAIAGYFLGAHFGIHPAP